MPYTLYKLIHLLGIFCVIAGTVGIAYHAYLGGKKSDGAAAKIGTMLHGIGLFVVLLGGFGMLARLGVSVMSGWVIAKLVIWILIGGLVAFPYKKPEESIKAVFAIILLATLAGYLALYKPF